MNRRFFFQLFIIGFTMFGFFKKAQAKSPAYEDGQIWVVQSGEFKGAKVILAYVENQPSRGEVFHIMIPGPIENSEGLVTSSISHLPFGKEGLDKSDLKLLHKNADVPDDWREGYEIWNEAASKGEAGIFSVTVSEAIDFAFQQMPRETPPETQLMDPNEIAYSDYQHESFPEPFLNRIKATTDAFEEIDGISFEQAVDLYRRDFDPESNIIIWEEMVRVYLLYCDKNCPDLATKKDVYNALLLASMFPKEEAIARVDAGKLTKADIVEIVSDYSLAPEPINVYKD